MNQDQWGIAMQGCAGVITDAINMAITELKAQPNFELRESKIIYIEIGTGEGKTVVQVCKILEKAGVDYLAVAVDIQDAWSFNQEKYLENIQEYVHSVELDLSGSPEALKRFKDEEVFAVLIDGDHTLEAVVDDFMEADRIVMRGGLIMFHDSGTDSQGADAFERQPRGIEVREAIEHLGLLKITNREPKGLDNYRVLVDHPDEPETQSRGIFIIQKTL